MTDQKKTKRPPRPLPTPEYIAEQRALREAARNAKRQALIAQGIDPDQPVQRFITRPMLSLPSTNEESKGTRVKIMTYNLLAQALIRRKLFPTSGDALKWFKRSKVLLAELKHYSADVMLLQEVDYIQFQSFWKPELAKCGYDSQYHRWGDKNHGVAIVYRSALFEMVDRMLIDYDREESGDIVPRTVTKNVGMMLALKFKEKNGKDGLLIGTTHLFWHPFGTYERTRQTYVILKKCKEFRDRVATLQGGQWTQLFGGDFNSQPFDAPYLSMTGEQPVEYRGRCRTVIECSTSFQFSKLREGEEDHDEEGGNIEKFGENQPAHPVPETFQATEEQLELVKKMAELHSSSPLRAVSLYSVGYKHVHPENSGVDNDVGEPEISNWAHTWRGLLDYICYMTESTPPKSLEEFEAESQIKLKGLLKMPLAKDMPEHGQPHEGEYASDHLCMMVDIEI